MPASAMSRANAAAVIAKPPGTGRRGGGEAAECAIFRPPGAPSRVISGSRRADPARSIAARSNAVRSASSIAARTASAG
jgi:hypothetical protein